MRHIRAHIAIGLAWTRQYKASAIPIGRVVKAHTIETRFIEGQRREISVDLIAYHQAIRTTAIAVGGDHQAVKKTRIGISPSRPNRSFAQYATLCRRLGLRPVVNQPTSPQRSAKAIIPLRTLQELFHIPPIAVFGIKRVRRVPGPGIGLMKLTRTIPFM